MTSDDYERKIYDLWAVMKDIRKESSIHSRTISANYETLAEVNDWLAGILVTHRPLVIAAE